MISQVDSARRHGILLDVVQVLTDLNLSIKKAYISSDGQWFMDGKLNLLKKMIFEIKFVLLACYYFWVLLEISVTDILLSGLAVFHVTDLNGNKLTDESIISFIEQVVITLNLIPFLLA